MSVEKASFRWTVSQISEDDRRVRLAQREAPLPGLQGTRGGPSLIYVMVVEGVVWRDRVVGM